MLFNVFSIDQYGNLVQLDDMLARQTLPPSPSPQPVDPDVIGGRKYKTARVGNQVWLAENLDFSWDGLSDELFADGSTTPSARYYDNDEATYGASGLNYGLLYDYAAVVYLHEHEKELIPGWRVPTENDFEELNQFVYDDTPLNELPAYGKNLFSTEGWINQGMPMELTDKYGFNAKPSGRITGGENPGELVYRDVGSLCVYWSHELSQPHPPSGISFRIPAYGLLAVDNRETYTNNQWNSIRLIKDV